MIPDLDAHGLLLPGVHSCTLEEARHVFACNAHRAALWERMLYFLAELRCADMAYPIYLAGGYISAKPDPEDIDVVHDLTGACGYNQYRGWALFSTARARIKAEYGVDYCVNLPGNNDFATFFAYVGPKTAAMSGLHEKDPRGILRIESRIWTDGLNK